METRRQVDSIDWYYELRGSGPGGQVALCLAVEHAALVRNVAVHEVPLPTNLSPMVVALTALPDAQIPNVCRDLFRNQMNEHAEAWDALGDEYHRRLERNYVTWVRRYVGGANVLRRFTPEELRGRPITWTIGGLTPAVAFFDNIVVAVAAGLPISPLMCRHFPQVSVPEVLADHIRRVAQG